MCHALALVLDSLVRKERAKRTKKMREILFTRENTLPLVGKYLGHSPSKQLEKTRTLNRQGIGTRIQGNLKRSFSLEIPAEGDTTLRAESVTPSIKSALILVSLAAKVIYEYSTTDRTPTGNEESMVREGKEMNQKDLINSLNRFQLTWTLII